MMPEVNLKIIADLREAEQSRVAVIENGKLAEIFIEYNLEEESTRTISSRLSRQGDIFKARVDTIVPAINAAFLAISSNLVHIMNLVTRFYFSVKLLNLQM